VKPTETDFNVLFTCAGRRVALLRAFRAAMEKLGVSGRILAADMSCASPAYQLADEGLALPPVRDDAYMPALLAAVRRHNVRLLVPTTDLDLAALATARDDFAALGCTVMVASPAAIAICRDKAATARLVGSLGLPELHTRTLDEFQTQPSWPCFVKPVSGSASIGSAVVLSPTELDQHVERFGRELIVQPVIEGPEFTVDVYRSRDGVVRCVVPRQRLLVRSGEVEQGITVRDEKLIAEAARIAEAIDGLWGVLCCQCRRDATGRDYFFEINARFGGGAPLSIAAGADLPLYLLQEVLGRPISAELSNFTDNLLMLRYDEAVFIPAGDPAALSGYDKPRFR
jgi:carbamoyl-phosphate synthase large subunit